MDLKLFDLIKYTHTKLVIEVDMETLCNVHIYIYLYILAILEFLSIRTTYGGSCIIFLSFRCKN